MPRLAARGLIVASLVAVAAKPCDAFVAITTIPQQQVQSATETLPGPAQFLTSSFAKKVNYRRRTKATSPLHSSITWDPRQVVVAGPTAPIYSSQLTQTMTSPLSPQSAPEESVDTEDAVLSDSLSILESLTNSLRRQPAPVTRSDDSLTKTFSLWKRRLVTREDWKHVHKLSGFLFLLSSWGLTGYAIRDLLVHGWTQPVTRWVGSDFS